MEAFDDAPAWSVVVVLLAVVPMMWFVGGQQELLGDSRYEKFAFMAGALVLSSVFPYALLQVVAIIVTFVVFSIATRWIVQQKMEARRRSRLVRHGRRQRLRYRHRERGGARVARLFSSTHGRS